MGRIELPPPHEPHPRNIYRSKPDINKFVDEFPHLEIHFSKNAVTNEYQCDYKNRDSLRALTWALMKRDFKLDIDIPNDKFVPTVPLRLNYLLWVEDILNSLAPAQKSESVRGIDIGKGASCLYTLLAARKNNWQMLTSESDDSIFSFAQNNINRNEMQHLVSVKKVEDEKYLVGLLEPGIVYDFCMFNPPLFCEQEGQIMMGKRLVPGKKQLQLIPKNELPEFIRILMRRDGESDFLRRTLINDSIVLKNKIRIYTAMVGHRHTIDTLLPDLFEIVGGKHRVCISPFHEGKLTRWGIAWTFDSDIILSDKNEELKTKPDVKIVQHVWHDITLERAVKRVQYLLDCAKVMHKVIDETDSECRIEMVALNGVYDVSNKNYKRTRRQIDAKYVKRMKPNYYGYQQQQGYTTQSNCDLYRGGGVNNDNYDTRHEGASCSTTAGESNEMRYSNRDVAIKADVVLRRSSDKNDVIMQNIFVFGRDKWNGLHKIISFLRSKWND